MEFFSAAEIAQVTALGATALATDMAAYNVLNLELPEAKPLAMNIVRGIMGTSFPTELEDSLSDAMHELGANHDFGPWDFEPAV